MNVTLKVDPERALNGKFPPNAEHPGFVQGWGVIKGPPEDREFAGIFVDRVEAREAARRAGSDFGVRWGSYSVEEQDFITGDSDDDVR